MKQIISIGTSISHLGGWLPELSRYLTIGKSEPIVAACLGKSSEASDWGLTVADKVAALRPDIVLIEFATNDAVTSKGISLAQSAANTTSIVSALRDSYPSVEIFLQTANPMLGFGADARPNLSSYYAQYNSLAASLDVGLADVFSAWPAASLDDIPDSVHPSIAAHRLYTLPTVAAAISPFID